MLARALRQCARSLLPMEATLGASSRQQAASVTSGPVGAVYNVGASTNIKFHDGMVPRETKEALLGQKGVVLWFTGAPRMRRSSCGVRLGAAAARHLHPGCNACNATMPTHPRAVRTAPHLQA